MKKTYLILCLLVGLNGFNVLTTGCSSPERTKYNATLVIVTSVETGMKVFNDFVGQGKITIEQEKRVRDYYRKYQSAMVSLRRVINPPIGQPEDSAEVDKIISNLTESRAALLTEIKKLTK